MKTPSHWNKNNLTAKMLLPFGQLYAAATALRLKLRQPKKVAAPVICIGNLTAGGTGKTPVAMAIAAILQHNGLKPAFISRGYGGRLKGVMADQQQHSAKDIGDEPLLLARQAPVSINADRYAAATEALRNGADILVMDDGFQNPGLFKDISFLVFDGSFGIGNGHPIPAGPLREKFTEGIKRASAAIIIGEDKHNMVQKLGSIPCFHAKIIAELPPLSFDKVIAFAGIGRPEKFYDSLRAQGVSLAETIDFPDHHFYTSQELQDLIDKAWQADADLVTTAKDFVKIPPEMRHHFKVLEIKIVWENEKEICKFINNNLHNDTSLSKDE